MNREFCAHCGYEMTGLIICTKCRAARPRKTEEEMCRYSLARSLKDTVCTGKSDEEIENLANRIIDAAKKAVPKADWEKPFALFAASIKVMTTIAERNQLKEKQHGISKS